MTDLRYLVPPLVFIYLIFPNRKTTPTVATEHSLQTTLNELVAITQFFQSWSLYKPSLSIIVALRISAFLTVPCLLVSTVVPIHIVIAVSGSLAFVWQASWFTLLRRHLWRSAWLRSCSFRLWDLLTGISTIRPTAPPPAVTSTSKNTSEIRVAFTITGRIICHCFSVL